MRVEPWHQTPWDWRAGVQFTCGGTGTGLLLMAAIAGISDSVWLLRAGMPALIFVAIGLLFVWLKLGRRWRFLFVFLNPRTSWISREAFFSLPLMGLGILAVLFGLSSVALLAALFGLGFLYAQARMLQEARGIPAWREGLMVPLILVTGLVEGASLLLIATTIFGDVIPWLPIILLLLVAIRFGVWRAYFQKLTTLGAAPLQTTKVLSKINQPIVLIGHGLPILLLVITLFVPNSVPILGTVAAFAALLGGWYMKFNLVARAAFNQGFAIERTPARTPGYSGLGVKPGWGDRGTG